MKKGISDKLSLLSIFFFKIKSFFLRKMKIFSVSGGVISKRGESDLLQRKQKCQAKQKRRNEIDRNKTEKNGRKVRNAEKFLEEKAKKEIGKENGEKKREISLKI